MAATMTFTIEEVPQDWTDEVVVDINAFENGWRALIDPEIPPFPVSLTRAHRRAREEPLRLVIARAAGGEVIGSAWLQHDEHNEHLVFAMLTVAPAHRRRGVGTGLLRSVTDIATELRRPTIILATDQLEDAADAFAASLGATVGIRNHINRLVIADADGARLQQWVDDNDGQYALEWIVPDGAYPDAALDDMARLRGVLLNDAPMDDVPVNKRTISHEEIRVDERRNEGYGRTRWTLIARHIASGEPVGYTEVFIDHHDARTVYQGATAVDGQHRGHRLGRQLKAAMFQRLVCDAPEAKYIRTFNADSNEPMLAVNNDMGFRPLFAAIRWLIETTDAQTWLEKRQ